MIPLARPRMFPTPVNLPSSWVIVLPVPPRINRKFISRTYVVSKEHREFKKQVSKKMMMMSMKPYEGSVQVKIQWYRARKAGDIDGIVKTLLDSLEGEKWGAYVNDRQVKHLEMALFDTDRFNPRVEVTISPWGG